LADGLFSQLCTSATICDVLFHVTSASVPLLSLSTADPLTVELKLPPGVVHGVLFDGVVALQEL
jgi:hypothetical protein